ncbi:MAG: hypothetical protein JXA61_02945 [Bacteroidales bacterium]|nr:hypothetical protein [Bacteroidales bacterium]
MKLTDVSKTAIATLGSHVVESKKEQPVINDPMAVYCVDKPMELLSEEDIKSILMLRPQHLAVYCMSILQKKPTSKNQNQI